MLTGQPDLDKSYLKLSSQEILDYVKRTKLAISVVILGQSYFSLSVPATARVQVLLYAA